MDRRARPAYGPIHVRKTSSARKDQRPIVAISFARKRGRPHANGVHGTIGAQVFALFRESVELPEIVMRTQQSPATIRALYEEYLRPLEGRASQAPDLADYDRSSRELDARIAALRHRSEPSPPRPPSLPQRDGGAGARGDLRPAAVWRDPPTAAAFDLQRIDVLAVGETLDEIGHVSSSVRLVVRNRSRCGTCGSPSILGATGLPVTT